MAWRSSALASGVVAPSAPGVEPNNSGRAERGIGIIRARARAMRTGLKKAVVVNQDLCFKTGFGKSLR